MDRSIVDQYAKGGTKARDAIAGLDFAALHSAPEAGWDAGKWTIAQVLVHLQDAEMAFADRVRRIVAQENPTLQAWDENRFFERLQYDEQSADDAVTLIDLTRRQLARMLRKRPDSDFQRTGQHSEAGQQTVVDVLTKANSHLDHHLGFVTKKRQLLKNDEDPARMAFDRGLIEQFASGGARVRQSINGLSRQDLLWKPPAEANVGLWSIQQVIVHLMDSDLIWTARMKCMIAEPNPSMLGYDESKFAANLYYDEQDATQAATVMDMNRREFAKVLRKLPEADFQRMGHHNEVGWITVAQSIASKVEHVGHHVGFIEKKLAWIKNKATDSVVNPAIAEG